MAAIAALSPFESGMLYDKDGNAVGKYIKDTGRGLFAHTFFEDMLSCVGCVDEGKQARACYDCKRMQRPDLYEGGKR